MRARHCRVEPYKILGQGFGVLSMKIVYLSRSSFPSFAANSVNVMKMCEAFTALGHDVILLGNFLENDIGKIFDCYGIKHRFEVKHIPSFNRLATDFVYVTRSVMVTKKSRPDIAYGRSLEACFGTAILGVPTVLEIHSPPRSLLKKILLKSLIPKRSFRRIVAISEGLAGYLVDKGFIQSESKGCVKLGKTSPVSKLCVAHDGADPDRFGAPSPPVGFEEKFNRLKATIRKRSNRLQVGYVGSLYPGKGMELISKVASLCPWADFHIVGGRPEEIGFWKKTCYRVDSDNIYFHGFMPHVFINFLCSLFDVALMPTQPLVSNVAGNVDEGWHISPLKLFEYMAAGLPIIASDLESTREVLEHGVTGFLLPPDNPAVWSEVLSFLRDHPEVRASVGKNARELLLKRFTWRLRAERVLKGI